jgi:ATP-dependent exoDNAse (exonuclease V) beta subunit
VGHLCIPASAGSGKTFRLAHRYIQLLSLKEPPERIAAMTFSRKAAGEIFDTIVGRLCRAATRKEDADEVSGHADITGYGPRDYLALLRSLLDSMDRLQVGTLDSFAVRIVRSFPLELGITMDFEVMETGGSVARAARNEVLRGILERRTLNASAQEAFLQSFKQATFGQEQKSLGRSLDRFVDEFHAEYRVLPEESGWGVSNTIWPGSSPWLNPVENLDAHGRCLRDFAESSGFQDRVAQKWFEFIDAATAYQPGSPWVNAIKYMMERLLPIAGELRGGHAEVRLFTTDCELDAELCRACLGLVTHVMGCEIRRKLETTKGIFQILRRFEAIYDDRVRKRGRLTFDDIQFLLSPNTASGGSRPLSGIPGEDRLYIDYRLDARLDHWLLDEFQDTSDLQWSVLENLIDEVVQDPSGRRTFFYVGDVKQAIYGWRGGNARLFDQIKKRYEKAIGEESLKTSYRSCAHVIDCVNTVFSPLPADRFPEKTRDRWAKAWENHEIAEGRVPANGHVSLLSPAADTERFDLAAGILREIDPVRRGLSIALLVRKNEEATELVKILRGSCEGMPVVHEGHAGVLDNPVVTALLSLFKAGAHPGDTFAWKHVRMTPLLRVVQERGLTRETLPHAVLGQVHATGYRGFFRDWGDALAQVVSLDEFGRRRLDDLVDAAGEFDAGGTRDAGAFLDFMDHFTLREGSSRNAVRVMTIHQAKGLGFDVVIVPALQGRPIRGGGGADVVTAYDDDAESPVWTLQMPRKLVAESDEVLHAEIRKHEEEKSFEALCVLYVAMTRARHAMYMIVDRPKSTATAYPAANFLLEQLEREGVEGGEPPTTFGDRPAHCHYTRGAWDWYHAHPELKTKPAPGDSKPVRKRGEAARTIRVRAVTRHAGAGNPFTDTPPDRMELGSAIHGLFEQVEWLSETNLPRTVESWRKTAAFPEDVREAAADHFRKACEAGAVKELLTGPREGAFVWRERPFQVMLGDGLLSGRFDRVVVDADKEGVARKASIIDFKSDSVVGGEDLSRKAESYRPQLCAYRQALSKLLPLDEARIECRLVFTAVGKVVDV